MNTPYFDTLQKSLTNPSLTPEALKELVDETTFFLQILRVKLESKEPDVREQAALELAALKKLLQAYT